MPKYVVQPVSEVCGLGEGPHWDSKNQVLYFVDAPNGDVCRYDVNKDETQKIHIGDGVVSIIIPCSNDDKLFVCSHNKKLLQFNWETKETKVLVEEIEKDIVGNRFNDGKCDAKGRLWVGTMGAETAPGVVPPDLGSLYCLDSSLKLVHKFPNVDLSNGLTWSLDNKKMYFIDSTKRLIYVFDFDLNTGNISNQRVLVDFNGNKNFTEKELPDGMTIDKTGKLWVALFFGGRLVKLDPDTGALLDHVRIPAMKTTSVCFGGPNLDRLYVTCASMELSEQEKKEQPDAGRVFVVTSDDPSFMGAAPHASFKL